MSSSLVKTLVVYPSLAQAAFGVWHFFVPQHWRWYSYIDPSATELVIAVRALNALFSLGLVLWAGVNILLVLHPQPAPHAFRVVLGASAILWLARVMLQLVWPQGSVNPLLQFGLLLVFVAIALGYCAAYVLVGKAG
jgi:hypothetical protein